MRVAVALLLMLGSVPAWAQSPQPPLTLRSGIQFRGDFWDGIATGPKVTQTGKHYVGLIQSEPNASPPPSDIAAVVNGLVEAYLNHHPERYADYAMPGAILYIGNKSRAPIDFLPKGFPFEYKGKLTANTPYYLGDKGMRGPPYVRVEWLVDGQFAFATWLFVFAGKVREIIVDSANVPPMPRAAFDPPEPPPPLTKADSR